MTSTYTRPAPSIDQAIAVDGTIYLADAGFPVRLEVDPGRLLDPVRIKLCQLPLPGGMTYDYLFLAWDNSLTTVVCQWVDEIIMLQHTRRQLKLADGTFATYGPSGDCGCGSRLGSYNPWPGNRMVGVSKPETPWSFS